MRLIRLLNRSPRWTGLPSGGSFGWGSAARLLGRGSFGAWALLLVTSGSSGCGSHEERSWPYSDIQIQSTALPLTLAGQTVNHVIPTGGTCPGPYVMSVIEGALPPGMYLDNPNRSIKGVALQEGNYMFRIRIDATGCDPAGTTNALFHWAISDAEAAR